jgi:lysozyme
MSQFIDPDQTANSSGNRLQPSNSCLDLIKKSEGYKEELPDGLVMAYKDPVGIWTIGYGSTRNLDDNTPIRQGDTITKATAERWLNEEVSQTANVVEQLCTVPITQSMFDALVSFGYNVGTGGGGLRTSTLLKKLNAKDYDGAAKEFGRWVNGTVNGQKVPFRGLVTRRQAEADLFKRDKLSQTVITVNAGDEQNENNGMIEQRPYEPAPLPLPFDRLLEVGLSGDDCFVLNCALTGLGLLRLGQQPNTFTTVTEDAVKVFQRREGIQVNGQVGATTQKAIELSLKAARDPVPPRSPDLTYCKLTRTRKPAYQGLEWCKLDFVNPQSQVEDSLNVISGAPGSQAFNLPKDSVAGSGEPIPQGRYSIANIDWAGGRDNYNAAHPITGNGLGPVWVELTGQQPDDRSAFGMHVDWNWIEEGHSPGSAGCVCPSTLNDLKELVRLLRKHDPRLLVVDWGL